MDVSKYGNKNTQMKMTLTVDESTEWTLDRLTPVNSQLRIFILSRIIQNDLNPMEKISEPGLANNYRAKWIALDSFLSRNSQSLRRSINTPILSIVSNCRTRTEQIIKSVIIYRQFFLLLRKYMLCILINSNFFRDTA